MSVAVREVPGLVIKTTRFGQVEVDDAQLVLIPDGLLGFESIHEYCLIPHAPGSPFHWLQALNKPELAFVVVNPFDFFAEYDFTIGDADVARLKLENAADVLVLTLVTISGEQVTTNLLGPLLVNARTRAARQIVLADAPYGTRHSLV
jgi:flagellar assembly factor FliW